MGESIDVATASLIDNWIDETERRTWFLSEIMTQRELRWWKNHEI
jgi:DNA-binding ferritin-like protein